MVRTFVIFFLMTSVFNVRAEIYTSENLIKTLVQGNGMIYLANYIQDMDDIHLAVWALRGNNLVHIADERISYIAKGDSYKVQNVTRVSTFEKPCRAMEFQGECI